MVQLVDSRSLMAHSTFDNSDVQATKRLWWNLLDMRRALPFLDDTGNISGLMQDLESVVTALTQGINALASSK